ncbi:hypothetical protein Syun_018116 [Stephania yunnanensis]|uniref:Uncharacterized protein n=1 Tax=Stephania yunnanensis TaxID=152371 RepID=A0AAP0IRT0_9MAGN
MNATLCTLSNGHINLNLINSGPTSGVSGGSKANASIRSLQKTPRHCQLLTKIIRWVIGLQTNIHALREA